MLSPFSPLQTPLRAPGKLPALRTPPRPPLTTTAAAHTPGHTHTQPVPAPAAAHTHPATEGVTPKCFSCHRRARPEAFSDYLDGR